VLIQPGFEHGRLRSYGIFTKLYGVATRGQLGFRKGIFHDSTLKSPVKNRYPERKPTSIRPIRPSPGATRSVCASAHTCAAERRLMLTGPSGW